jgi:hypothetical protein
MQYLLLMYLGEAWNQLSLTARQQIYGEQLQLAHQLTASGQYRGGAPHCTRRRRRPVSGCATANGS